MVRPRPACGTAGGYRAHKRRGEEADQACLQAHAAMNKRNYRERSTAYTRARERARQAAKKQLIEAHPAEYRRLWHEELSKQLRAAAGEDDQL